MTFLLPQGSEFSPGSQRHSQSVPNSSVCNRSLSPAKCEWHVAVFCGTVQELAYPCYFMVTLSYVTWVLQSWTWNACSNLQRQHKHFFFSRRVLLQTEHWGVSPIVQDGAGGGSYTEHAKGQKDEWAGPEHAKRWQDVWLQKESLLLLIPIRTVLEQEEVVFETGSCHSPRSHGSWINLFPFAPAPVSWVWFLLPWAVKPTLFHFKRGSFQEQLWKQRSLMSYPFSCDFPGARVCCYFCCCYKTRVSHSLILTLQFFLIFFLSFFFFYYYFLPRPLVWKGCVQDRQKRFHRITFLSTLTRKPSYSKDLVRARFWFFHIFEKVGLHNPSSPVPLVLIIYPVRSLETINLFLETAALSGPTALLSCVQHEKGEGSGVRLSIHCCKLQLIWKAEYISTTVRHHSIPEGFQSLSIRGG